MAYDPALLIMGVMLVLLMWGSAISLWLTARYPTDERREAALRLVAASMAYGGGVVLYLLVRHL